MLWLCLKFPLLALDVFPPAADAAVAVAGARVHAANAAAQAAGVAPGMRLASALALAPGLRVHERVVLLEEGLLRQLACWAEAFTPQVSLAPPDELLLEVGGCLRLFGGLDALCARVRAALPATGSAAVLALAPTPRAAQWLARAGDETPCLAPAALAERLAPLPLGVLDGLDGARQRTLATLGVTVLGELYALPAAGLQRRFGAALSLQLAQAAGSCADPRAAFVFPEHFAERLELPARVGEAGMLRFAARRLLGALAGWLSARAAGVAACVLELEHEDAPPSALELRFAEPTADAARFARVLDERLEHYRLIEPVWRIRLVAATPATLEARNLGLFGQDAAQALAPVIERLRARLGDEAVGGLAIQADHRPECATRSVRGEGQGAAAAAARPLWLLAAPRALAETAGQPCHEGAALRLSGPERIESGWWSAGEGGPGDVRRDYFVARNAHGQWLWVFRDAGGWWLHGLFA